MHSVSKPFANVSQQSCTRDRKFCKTFANVSIRTERSLGVCQARFPAKSCTGATSITFGWETSLADSESP